MFREGMPPVLDKESGRQMTQEEIDKYKMERDIEEDIGSLQAGLMSPEDFVKSVFAREGGDPARAEQAADSIKKFWVTQLDSGKITPQEFSEGVYKSAVKMLKKREDPTEKDKAREAAHKATLERVTGKRRAA